MKRYCVKCGKQVSKKSNGLCRSCYEKTSNKTKRCCVVCGSKLSANASSTGGQYCRKCWLSGVKERRLYWQNHNWLYNHYITNKMSISEIAVKVNSYQSNVGWWLHKFNIPVRSNGGTKPRKYVDKKNYVNIWLPGHPTASKARPYKREHVLVMEKHLNKILSKEEQVHHLNGIKNDNRIENLKYFPNSSAHKIYEGKVQQFAKELIWGDLNPELKPKLLKLFTQYLSKNG
jgi:hypothetical protein